MLARDRDVHLTIDIRLQLRAKEILERRLRAAGAHNGAVVVMDSATGDVLAMVSAPAPDPPGVRTAPPTPDELLDRARYGQYPPGSTFKLVTAIAALRGDPDAASIARTSAARSRDGRAGNVIAGWNRADQRRYRRSRPRHARYGTRHRGLLQRVLRAARRARRRIARRSPRPPRRWASRRAILPELRKSLPFAAYGQGEVLISPFKMARVAATIAAGGRMPQGRWSIDDSNARTDAPLAGAAGRAGGVPRGRDAARRHRRHGAARHGRLGDQLRRQDRHGAARRGPAAFLVHRLRSVRRRPARIAWPSPCWWNTADMARASPRRSRAR